MQPNTRASSGTLTVVNPRSLFTASVCLVRPRRACLLGVRAEGRRFTHPLFNITYRDQEAYPSRPRMEVHGQVIATRSASLGEVCRRDVDGHGQGSNKPIWYGQSRKMCPSRDCVP